MVHISQGTFSFAHLPKGSNGMLQIVINEYSSPKTINFVTISDQSTRTRMAMAL
jgi:hypothetical protein